jgi:uncharacterized protein (TIGR02594 family)
MASGGGKIVKANLSIIGPDAPEHLRVAAQDLDLREEILVHGVPSSNPKVEDYIKAVTGKRADARNVPWCAYWLGGILEKTKNPSTKSGMARSYLQWGVDVTDEPWQQGDVVVLWRGRKNDRVTGHVAFLVSWDDDSMVLLGGNQGDKVCFQTFSSHKLLGVRRLRPISKSRTVKAAVGATVNEVVLKPAVEAVPNPAPIEAINKAQDSLSSVQPVIDTIGAWKPYIKVLLTTLTVAFALAILYYRVSDAKDKGRT